MEKLILIDGNSLANRAFYALPPLSNREGLQTNAILGFCNILFKIIEQEKPQFLAVAFDTKAPTFRHKIFDGYKGTRHKSPDEFNQQIPVLKELLKAMNIDIYEGEGFEADDIIGTLAKKGKEKNLYTLIITGDKDVFQLADESVGIMITKKGISEIDFYDKKSLKEKYGLEPKQFIDLKALMGDKSDNIPGVPGVGEKTAIKLLEKYSAIEEIYNNLDNIKGKLKETLSQNKELSFLSKKLATINLDGPFDIKDRWKGFNNEELLKIFTKLEFKAYISKLADKPVGIVQSKETPKGSKYALNIISPESWINSAKELGLISLAVEYEGEDGRNQIPIGISLSTEKGSLFYLNPAESKDLLPIGIIDILGSTEIKKAVYDGKNTIHSLNSIGIKLKGIKYDLSIMAYLLNPEDRNELPDIIYRNLGVNIETIEEITGKGKNKKKLQEIDGKIIKEYSLKKSRYILDCVPSLENQIIKNELSQLYYGVELPLMHILYKLENYGFKIDKSRLEELLETFSREIEKITGEIFEMTGEKFNINSPKQLSFILFEKMGLPVIKKTKTGISTDNEVLERLALDYPVVSKIQTYRLLNKVKTTYIDGLLNLLDPKTGKVHTSLKQTVTATGRLSSSEPNLQNIPIRIELGRQLRKAFVPSVKENILFTGDYSQIELRILAHISGDPGLIDAYIKGQDIHTRTASEVFGVPLKEVTSDLRNKAKAVNFGIVYGISDFGLANDLKISRKEAKEYIDSYFEKYPGVRNYINEVIKFGREKGYVKTLWGRIRYLPNLNNKNFVIRSFAERTAMNTPIQGSAADIIKMAMVKMDRVIKERDLPLKLLLQVHDELVFEGPKEEAEELSAIIKEVMEGVAKLKVPLIVDIKTGPDWYNVKKI